MRGDKEWPPEKLEALKALWNEKHTAREIYTRLGITKNALIGKARRLGLTFQSLRPGGKGVAGRKKPKPRRIVPKQVIASQETVSNLSYGQCRWINDDRTFCGQTVRKSRSSYCPEHHAIVWRPVPPPKPKGTASTPSFTLSRGAYRPKRM